jgi:hypothetical protein
MASPLLGRICASQFSGRAKNNPVGIKTLSMGAIVMGLVKKALISIPDEPVVAYSGKG